MTTNNTDLITQLLSENLELRKLVLTEQEKVSMERKRRIEAEARLAALLSKKVIEMRERNSYSDFKHDSCKRDRRYKDMVGHITRPKSSDSSYENEIALLVMKNIQKYQNCPPTSESSLKSTSISPLLEHERNFKRNNNLPLVTEKKVQPSIGANNRQSVSISEANISSNNYLKPATKKISDFWTFIDMNGETKPSVPPLHWKQQKCKDTFIKRSIERQIRIKEASSKRKQLAAKKREVAKQLLAGHVKNQDAVKLLSIMDREICAFPPNMMKRETFRRVCKTQGFQERRKKKHDEYDKHINRLLAYCYSQAPNRLNRK
ncbi:unnamed protein product [Thelazia callipaeda]|uniref:ALMS motif domain-containing protein n=1 Tax=Thelazia callipaeda TaxID=103827 RepID=A0A0N5CNM4_THECL|nr:unnamed protein product [Thelazia callipaeda]